MNIMILKIFAWMFLVVACFTLATSEVSTATSSVTDLFTGFISPARNDGGGNVSGTRTVYNYVGNTDYNESCTSDESMATIFQTQDQPIPTENLLNMFNSFTCNVSKFLECREVGVEHDVKSGRGVRAEVNPIWKCVCPNYEKVESIHPDAYFDHSLGHCVFKVRSKCSSLIIPPSGRRYNSTSANGVIVGRVQPPVLPCVKNAKCNIIDESTKSTDVNRNRCICEKGFFPGDDNECYKAEEGLFPGSVIGLLLVIITFALFFSIMLCENEIFDDQKHGSQEELIIPGDHFRKQLFSKTKRRINPNY